LTTAVTGLYQQKNFGAQLTAPWAEGGKHKYKGMLNQVDQTGSDGNLQRARKESYSEDVSTRETKPNT
jgi:hypothetical protein